MEKINYFGKEYPVYKLSDMYKDKQFYTIYCEFDDSSPEPFVLNINGIEHKMDKYYTVEYIEHLDENNSIVKAVENDYFFLNKLEKYDSSNITFNCPTCNKQFYHKTKTTCNNCIEENNSVLDINRKGYYYYLISVINN